MSLLLRKPLLSLTLFALAVRGWTFGNPALHVDDQFYMLVGQRLMDGALPYVDLWDRKPIGLFLIYGFAGKLPGGPVLGYQMLATLCVIATAWLICRLAQRWAGPVPALAGAMAYVAWLPLFGGIGGQSPVFYNLPMLLAAWLIVPLVQGGERWITGIGCVTMALAGAAMQIKYSALFEGVYFGLTLLWLSWRAHRSTARLLGDGALWLGCALAPTLAAWAFYAAQGHGEAFVQANFLSVFQDHLPLAPALERLFWQIVGLTPFWLCLGLVLRRWTALKAEQRWLIGWAAAAFAGYLAFGNWFDHYVLPLLPPLCVVTAIGLAAVRWRRTSAALLVGLGLAAGLSRAAVDMLDRGTTGEVAALTALVEQNRGSDCLYVTEDITALYVLTNSCLPTRYIMPDHLALARFRDAIGANQAAEMAKVLASRPSVIVYMNDPEAEYAPETRAMLEAALHDHYVKAGERQTGEKLFSVYRLVP